MSESLHLYLTSTQAYLRKRTGYFGRGSVESVAEWGWNVLEPSSLTIECEKKNWKRRTSLDVFIGSSLCKFMIAELPPDAKENEYSALAAAQMVHKLGLNVSEWDIDFEADRTNKKLFACAARRDVVERLKELSQEHGLKLLSLRPIATGIWNRSIKFMDEAHPRNSLIAIENDAVTIFASQSGVLQKMNSFYHRQEPDLISREVRRIRLSTEEEHHIAISMAKTVLNLGSIYAEQVVESIDVPKPDYAADFSDMFVPTKAEIVSDDNA